MIVTEKDLHESYELGFRHGLEKVDFLRARATKAVSVRSDATGSIGTSIKEPTPAVSGAVKRGVVSKAPRSKRTSVIEPIKDLLSAGTAASVAHIASTIGAKPASVAVALQNLKKSGFAINQDGKWMANGGDAFGV